MLRPVLVILIATAIMASPSQGEAKVKRREMGNLVIEGVPEIPESLV